MVDPPESVNPPPILELAIVKADASAREALSVPPVVSVAVPIVLPALVSAMAPLVVVAVSAAAWIAPLCPMAPPLVSTNVPPTEALEMVNADAL